ncbi:MAG TPA: NAD(P)H-dependent oxidoreductase [Candidatus Krumholzibacteria bacterium]|nr:NAD(P)H-dependent oxidoreductase [Candidatus Krumholzibacteria bacterium]
MSESPLNVLAVSGSLHERSVTLKVLSEIGEGLREVGCTVDILDLREEPLPLFDPDTAYEQPEYERARERVLKADVFLLGTPDYHGSPSGVLKNFLDHFWREFSGKLIATIVASHEKGLTVTDQLRTIARQCYAWTLPYGVSFNGRVDLKDGRIASEALEKRAEMLVHDIRVYGRLLAQQRAADLAGKNPGFLARLRK